MCTSPLHLHQLSLGMSFDVPCNDCLECRSASQNSWLFRINKDLEDLYDRGGKGVFLTFTYNNKCLPHSDFGFFDSKPIPCFSSDDVSGFLNKVKVFANRNFGKSAYKYFWCSEYGKFTRRPHYHALFLLEPQVDWYLFCETCRKYWHFGFMFPRNINGKYYDNKLNFTSPLLRNHHHASSYVSKYVTKDVDYYGLPLIKRYLNVRKTLLPIDRATFNKCLPRHFQSKGIGSSFIKELDTPDKLYSALDKGVLSPNRKKMIQLPRYYVEKLCFDHVRVGAHGESVVLRSLRSEYASCIALVHRRSYESKALSLYDFFLSCNDEFLLRHGFNFRDVELVSSFRNSNTEYLVSRYFVACLSSPYRKVFHDMGLSFCFNDIVDFRMFMYDHSFNNFDVYADDSDIIRLFDVFHKVFDPIRNDRQIEYHKQLLLQKKYHLLSLNLITYE